MYKLITALLSSLIMFQGPASAALCPNPVTFLKKGDITACEGYLFSPEKELQVRLINEEFKLIKGQNEIKVKIIRALEKDVNTMEFILQKEQEKAELWRLAAENTTLKYIELEGNRTKRDLLFLGGGILLTVLSGWAIGQAANR